MYMTVKGLCSQVNWVQCQSRSARSFCGRSLEIGLDSYALQRNVVVVVSGTLDGVTVRRMAVAKNVGPKGRMR